MRRVVADDAVALARSWFPEPDDLSWLLAVLRQRARGFTATFLSAYGVGAPLPADLAAEVAVATARTALLRKVQQTLQAAVPDVVAVKGLAVADAYPEGVARRLGDLDLVTGDEAALWQVVEVGAREFGLTVRAVLTFPVPSTSMATRGLMVTLKAVPRTPFEEPVALDVSTHALVGDGTGVPAWPGPRGRRPGPADHLVMIAAERLEQPFTPKDVFDAAVLAGEVADGGGAALAAARALAREIRLEPEFAELLELAAFHELPVPDQLRFTRSEVRAARARRGRELAAVLVRHPLEASLHAVQRAEVLPSRGAGPRRQLWRAADRWLSPQAPVRRALFGFGLPVVVDGHSDRPLLRSPAGDYLLVNGREVTDAWLDAALAPAPDPEMDLFGPDGRPPATSERG